MRAGPPAQGGHSRRRSPVITQRPQQQRPRPRVAPVPDTRLPKHAAPRAMAGDTSGMCCSQARWAACRHGDIWHHPFDRVDQPRPSAAITHTMGCSSCPRNCGALLPFAVWHHIKVPARTAKRRLHPPPPPPPPADHTPRSFCPALHRMAAGCSTQGCAASAAAAAATSGAARAASSASRWSPSSQATAGQGGQGRGSEKDLHRRRHAAKVQASSIHASSSSAGARRGTLWRQAGTLTRRVRPRVGVEAGQAMRAKHATDRVTQGYQLGRILLPR